MPNSSGEGSWLNVLVDNSILKDGNLRKVGQHILALLSINQRTGAKNGQETKVLTLKRWATRGSHAFFKETRLRFLN